MAAFIFILLAILRYFWFPIFFIILVCILLKNKEQHKSIYGDDEYYAYFASGSMNSDDIEN